MRTENDLILEQARLRYHVVPSREIRMGVTGNRVFEVRKGQTAFILRAAAYTPERHAHTAFELNWMAYLSDTLSGIVKPQKSVRGDYVETVRVADKAYILCLFEKAPGKTVDAGNPAAFNETLYFNLGALMGDMHRLTVDYPGNVRTPAFEWTGATNAWRYDRVIDDAAVRRRQQQYFDEIGTLPISRESYGIIHWDIHADNFFVDNGKIKLFDFDACQFNWYAADMASAIFFMVMKGAGPLARKSEAERTAFAEAYLLAYLKGYAQSHTVSEYWIKKLDLFMRYQMCDEYLSAQFFWPDEHMADRAWYLDWHRERIVKGLPYVQIDYEKVLAQTAETSSVPGGREKGHCRMSGAARDMV